MTQVRRLIKLSPCVGVVSMCAHVCMYACTHESYYILYTTGTDTLQWCTYLVMASHPFTSDLIDSRTKGEVRGTDIAFRNIGISRSKNTRIYTVTCSLKYTIQSINKHVITWHVLYERSNTMYTCTCTCTFMYVHCIYTCTWHVYMYIIH